MSISSWPGIKTSAVSQGPQDNLVPVCNSLLFLNHAVSIPGGDTFVELNFSAMCSVTAFVLVKQEEGSFLTIAAFIGLRAAVLVVNQTGKMCQIEKLN